jgi:membrane AbrB-like protein
VSGSAVGSVVSWRVALALLLGSAGGIVFSLASMPLPWMLGPMVFNTIAAILSAPIASPGPVRPFVVVVIGVMLGSGFSPDILQQIPAWIASLGLLAAFIAVAGLGVVPYYRYVAGFDPKTAFFAGMPGGLNEMVVVGEAMGADERRVALAHASRILIVVFAVTFWSRLTEGSGGTARDPLSFPFGPLAIGDLLILIGCGVLGFVLGRRLRLPAPTMLGPMILSALVHLSGLTAAEPPAGIVQIAQVFLGTIIGCRFAGSAARDILRALALSAGATAVMLLITAVFTLLASLATGQGTDEVLLAFSPGGLTEMSLVAISLDADVAYIATHHIVRISLVIMLAPLVFRLLFRMPRPGGT